MTVTTEYNVFPSSYPATVPGYAGTGSYGTSITGLSNGGYAVIVEDDDNYADLDIYNAFGGLVASDTGFDAVDTRIIQLSNGNILVVGTSNNTLAYRTFDLNGQVVGAGTVNRYDNLSKVSLVATANGGFATAAQRFFTGTNNDIYVTLPGLTAPVIIDASAADDENPSIAQLADGDYAVAWERIDSGTHASAIWYAILKPDGSFRQFPVLADSGGSINTNPSVAALPNGGFTITYEDNGYDNIQDDITEQDYTASGALTHSYRLSASTNRDYDTSSAALAGGYVLTTFSDLASAGNYDVHVSLTDTAGNLLINGAGLLGATTADYEDGARITTMANGHFAISFADQTTQNVKVGVYYLERTIIGDSGDNVITGDSLDDVVFGGDGNDTIIPGGGSGNEVAGGAGYDTLVLSGPSTNYTISRSMTEIYVTGPGNVLNQMNGIERLQFSDRYVYTPEEVRDLDGNGVSDMLLQNSSNGAIRVWTLNSDGSRDASTATSKPGTTALRVVGTGQFNFAADDNADILVQSTNGAMAIWEMTGATVTATANLGNMSNVWQAVTTGDFNRDGNADILLQNTSTGQLEIWLMNGATPTAKTMVGGAPGTAWHAIATADFNGDGKSDILMQNDNGQVLVRLMNGATILSSTNVGSNPGGLLKAVSAGDFNGDGKADIVLQNSSTNEIVIWTMNGSSLVSSTTVGTAASGLTLMGTGDFNADGKADLMFQQAANGSISEWLMNGTTVLTKQGVGASPGAAWHLVAGTGG